VIDVSPASFLAPELTALNRLTMTSARSITPDRVTSLDGDWSFQLVDSPDRAPRDWQTAPVDEWRTIAVPGVWTRQDTGDLPHYTNIVMPFPGEPPFVPDENPTGLYRRTFDRPTADRVLIEFGRSI